MKVRYIGDYYKVVLEKGKTYDVECIETGPSGDWYRILLPDLDDDGLFSAADFEIVEDSDD